MTLADIKRRHIAMFQNCDDALVQTELASKKLLSSLAEGNKILICGNGGSASDAQHFAAELTGRFENSHRRPLPAIALTTDTSALTAIGNDFGFGQIFSRQVDALCKPGDVVIGISTSGRSENIEKALAAATKNGGTPIILTGEHKSALSLTNLIEINAPSSETARIQEFHIFCLHCICTIIDKEFGDG